MPWSPVGAPSTAPIGAAGGPLKSAERALVKF